MAYQNCIDLNFNFFFELKFIKGINPFQIRPKDTVLGKNANNIPRFEASIFRIINAKPTNKLWYIIL